MRKTVTALGILAAGLVALAVNSGGGQTPAANDEQLIRQAVAAYTDAFNKNDASALPPLWAADAEYVDEQGKLTKGRDAIVAHFKQSMAGLKGAKIAFRVTRTRFLRGGDVA